MFFQKLRFYLLYSLILFFGFWSGIAVSACDTDDYGNSFDTATKVSPNGTVRGLVNCESDYDFFGVELTKAGKLTISLANVYSYAWFYRTKDDAQRFNYPSGSFDLPAGIYHFVVSGHANKPYKVTLSCNDCTGVATPTKVTSVTPAEVKFKQKTTFTITGTKLPNTLAAHIHDCKDPSGKTTLQVNHISNTKQTFECIPSYTTGQKQYVIKDKSGGKTLKTGFINVKESANIPPTSPQITIPSSAKVGETITVSIKLGTDQDGDQVKVSCNANSSNYSTEDKNNKNPYVSGFVAGGSIIKITDLVFNNSGNKSIICTTIDKRNASSSSTSKGINITPKVAEKYTLILHSEFHGTIQSSPNGTSCNNDTCSKNHPKNTWVNVTATPDTEYKFKVWSGACTGTGACKIYMDENKKLVRAIFEKINIQNHAPSSPQINAPSSTKVNTPTTFSVQLGTDQDGDKVQVKCSADSSNYTSSNHYKSGFKSGGATVKVTNLIFSSTGGKKLICTNFDEKGNASKTVSHAINVTPKSTENIRLNVSSPKGGTIYTYGNDHTKPVTGINCGSDCSEDYKKGSTVKLTVKSDDGYKFVRWEGDCRSNANGLCSLTMDSNKTVKALFKKKENIEITNLKATDSFPTLYRINSNGNLLKSDGNSINFNSVFSASLKLDRDRYGIVTDGNARLFISASVNRKDVNVYFKILNSGQTNLSIYGLDDNHNQISTNNEKIIKSKKVGNNSNIAVAVLLAGKSFGSNENKYPAQIEACVYTDKSEGRLCKIIAIFEYTPPVVLIHGLWAGADSWDGNDNNQGVKFILDNLGYVVSLFNYDGNIGPEGTLNNKKNDFISTIKRGCDIYNSSFVACTKVDIIGHSMGSLVAREYIQNRKFYRTPNNYYTGSVRKLISLSTPHLGSPLANLLLYDNENKYGCVSKEDRKYIDKAKAIMLPFGKKIDSAIKSIAVGSDFLVNLNKSKNILEKTVDVYSLYNDYMHIIDLNILGDFLIEKQLVLAGCATGFSNDGVNEKIIGFGKGVIPIDLIYGTENTDGVVGVSSQKGGFNKNYLVGKNPHTGMGQLDSIAYELNVYLRK